MGFAIDPQPLRESVAMLDTPDDFRTFFAQLASGDDPLRAKRLQLAKLTNQYTDGHSAERVAAWRERRVRPVGGEIELADETAAPHHLRRGDEGHEAVDSRGATSLPTSEGARQPQRPRWLATRRVR